MVRPIIEEESDTGGASYASASMHANARDATRPRGSVSRVISKPGFADGLSRSGEREAERSRNSGSHQPSAAAQTNGCAREKQRLEQSVLDGADFDRDVLDSYPQIALWLDATRIISELAVIRVSSGDGSRGGYIMCRI